MGGDTNGFSVENLIIYPITKYISPILHNFNIMPNHVTIFNIFF